MKNYIYIILCFALNFNISPQEVSKYNQIKIGTNYRLLPGSNHQFEVSIVKDPFNSDILFASSNTFLTSIMSEGTYISTNGGISWEGNDTCKGEPVTLHGGDPGIVIDKDFLQGCILITRLIMGEHGHFKK